MVYRPGHCDLGWFSGIRCRSLLLHYDQHPRRPERNLRLWQFCCCDLRRAVARLVSSAGTKRILQGLDLASAGRSSRAHSAVLRDWAYSSYAGLSPQSVPGGTFFFTVNLLDREPKLANSAHRCAARRRSATGPPAHLSISMPSCPSRSHALFVDVAARRCGFS